MADFNLRDILAFLTANELYNGDINIETTSDTSTEAIRQYYADNNEIALIFRGESLSQEAINDIPAQELLNEISTYLLISLDYLEDQNRYRSWAENNADNPSASIILTNLEDRPPLLSREIEEQSYNAELTIQDMKAYFSLMNIYTGALDGNNTEEFEISVDAFLNYFGRNTAAYDQLGEAAASTKFDDARTMLKEQLAYESYQVAVAAEANRIIQAELGSSEGDNTTIADRNTEVAQIILDDLEERPFIISVEAHQIMLERNLLPESSQPTANVEQTGNILNLAKSNIPAINSIANATPGPLGNNAILAGNALFGALGSLAKDIGFISEDKLAADSAPDNNTSTPTLNIDRDAAIQTSLEQAGVIDRTYNNDAIIQKSLEQSGVIEKSSYVDPAIAAIAKERSENALKSDNKEPEITEVGGVTNQDQKPADQNSPEAEATDSTENKSEATTPAATKQEPANQISPEMLDILSNALPSLSEIDRNEIARALTVDPNLYDLTTIDPESPDFDEDDIIADLIRVTAITRNRLRQEDIENAREAESETPKEEENKADSEQNLTGTTIEINVTVNSYLTILGCCEGDIKTQADLQAALTACNEKLGTEIDPNADQGAILDAIRGAENLTDSLKEGLDKAARAERGAAIVGDAQRVINDVQRDNTNFTPLIVDCIWGPKTEAGNKGVTGEDSPAAPRIQAQQQARTQARAESVAAQQSVSEGSRDLSVDEIKDIQAILILQSNVGYGEIEVNGIADENTISALRSYVGGDSSSTLGELYGNFLNQINVTSEQEFLKDQIDIFSRTGDPNYMQAAERARTVLGVDSSSAKAARPTEVFEEVSRNAIHADWRQPGKVDKDSREWCKERRREDLDNVDYHGIYERHGAPSNGLFTIANDRLIYMNTVRVGSVSGPREFAAFDLAGETQGRDEISGLSTVDFSDVVLDNMGRALDNVKSSNPHFDPSLGMVVNVNTLDRDVALLAYEEGGQTQVVLLTKEFQENNPALIQMALNQTPANLLDDNLKFGEIAQAPVDKIPGAQSDDIVSCRSGSTYQPGGRPGC